MIYSQERGFPVFLIFRWLEKAERASENWRRNALRDFFAELFGLHLGGSRFHGWFQRWHDLKLEEGDTLLSWRDKLETKNWWWARHANWAVWESTWRFCDEPLPSEIETLGRRGPGTLEHINLEKQKPKGKRVLAENYHHDGAKAARRIHHYGRLQEEAEKPKAGEVQK